MAEIETELNILREELRSGAVTPLDVMRQAQARADASASLQRSDCGTYVWRDVDAAIRAAEELPARFPDPEKRPPLYGIPVSVKDCFDLVGTVTGCGSKFYSRINQPATENAWIVERLLGAGAVVTGKSHLHQLAYGITGENEDYGNPLQPRDRTLLTGGSSSGAVASVQEGSALVAIGTDTGGSVRVPAALCGMAGYRASHALYPEKICWQGGAHLAPSFDTLGLLFKDLRDGPFLGATVFGLAMVEALRGARIGFVTSEFLSDCDADVTAAFAAWKDRLRLHGATLESFDTEFWGDGKEIFMAIQAHEAAGLHRGKFANFEKPLQERLAWGASITAEQVAALRLRQKAFCSRMEALFEDFDFLILPCAPVSRLVAGEDQSGARSRILRYTAPISMAGLPTVTLPGELAGDYFGTGVQLVGNHLDDAQLLAFAATLA